MATVFTLTLNRATGLFDAARGRDQFLAVGEGYGTGETVRFSH